MRTIELYYYKKGWEGKEIPIYQYMDLDYLFCLLENNVYFVNPKCHFEDKRESALPIKSLFGFNSFGVQLNKEEIQRKSNEVSDKIKKYSDSAYWSTSCWTKDDTESLLMWKNYTTKMGVRIKSNINNFVASINTDEFKILCGHIAYDGYTLKSFEECLFSKEKYYKDEREVRFYFMPNDDRNYSHKGMDIPIDPKTLIEEIVLSPYIKRSAAEKIAEVIRTEYGINNIHPSKIEIKK